MTSQNKILKILSFLFPFIFGLIVATIFLSVSPSVVGIPSKDPRYLNILTTDSGHFYDIFLFQVLFSSSAAIIVSFISAFSFKGKTIFGLVYSSLCALVITGFALILENLISMTKFYKNFFHHYQNFRIIKINYFSYFTHDLSTLSQVFLIPLLCGISIFAVVNFINISRKVAETEE